MRTRLIVSSAVLLLLVGIAVTSATQAANDPMSGTWKLNLAKSKYDPGPAPKSNTVTIRIENDTETYETEGVDASGNTTRASFNAKLDGTGAPVSGIPYADTVSIKRMAPNHVVATLKRGGKVAMTVDVVVAADGMSRTVTYSGKNERGEDIRDVLVFDKQLFADPPPRIRKKGFDLKR